MRLMLPACLAALLLAPASANARVVLDEGHVDYAARLIGGRLEARIKDDTGRIVRWRKVGSVVFHARSSTRTRLPADGSMSFLGRAGTRVWVLPQTQRAGVLWAGWNTEEISSRQVRGPVQWTLRRVQGPGRLAVFQTGSFGDHDVLFNSRDGLPDTRRVALGVHAHGNWAFTAAGHYRLTFRLHARTRSGKGLHSAATLRIAVGDVDPDR